MKHILKLTIVITLLFSVSAASGQVETIDYTLENNQVVFSGETESINSTITKSGNALQWTQQNNGNVNTTDFQIINTTGNWDQNTSTGTVTYTVVLEGFQGSFVLEGTSTNITAVLTIDINGDQQYTFSSNTITYQ